MIRGILAMTVDGSEQEPIGVFADVIDARDAILREEMSRMEGEDHLMIEDANEAFLTNFQAALDEVQTTPSVDLLFESGFGSWDIRLVSVPLYLDEGVREL